MDRVSFFQNQIEDFSNQSKITEKSLQETSLLRILVFIFGSILCYFTFDFSQLLSVSIGIVALVLFLWLVKKHQNTAYQLSFQRANIRINEDELNRQKLVFVRQETGLNFSNLTHFYTNDFDIFGSHSLFKLLNRAYTQNGMKLLAHWLSTGADAIEISVRQVAVKELSDLFDWRQDFQATAQIESKISEPTDFLLEWVNTSDNQTINKLKYFRFLPIITLLVWFFIFIDIVPIGFGIVLLLAHFYISGQVHKATKDFSQQSDNIVDTLKTFSKLLEKIENQDFKSDKIKQLQSKLNSDSKASVAIKSFSRIVENLNFRLNVYFWILIGMPTLWDLHWFIQLEKWKQTHKNNLKSWLDVLSEVEALNSLAGFSFANPDYIFPESSHEKVEIKATKIAHPLLKKEKRIANDFSMNGVGETVLITGSNMSGKSTFLRTLGVNLVLANMGSVVCATSFKTSQLLLFTSMRTQDSLAENTSSFYAELKRLKTLLTITEKNNIPVLYFLDEILKGTNSDDRHKGAKALIEQLHTQNTSGFVSTHDLELGEMADRYDFVHNYSFKSYFEDDVLKFDYKLEKGICQEANAAALMRQIGIKIKE